MAEESTTTSSGTDITITVKGPSELKLSITTSSESSVLNLKESIAEKGGPPKEQQRLIYSGKVLKDEEKISTYKIKTGHTIHMVKSAARAAEPTPAPAAVPPLNTGFAPNNLNDTIENHHGLAGFNPFGQMGVGNLNDPNALTGLLDNDAFLQQMSQLMQNPEVVEQMIASNPQLAAMGPQFRQAMNSPFVRQMMSNPQTLRAMMQMSASMNQNGGMGMGGGFPPFGAPGAPGAAGGPGAGNDAFANLFAQAGAGGAAGNTTGAAAPAAGANREAATGGATGAAGAGTAAGGATGAAAGQPANPWAAMFGMPPGAGAGAAGTGAAPAFNPWAMDMFGGGPFGGGFGAGGPPAPADNRTDEERYATQLGQLAGMGLLETEKNIRALRRVGGNVEAAIELLFSGALDGPGN